MNLYIIELRRGSGEFLKRKVTNNSFEGIDIYKVRFQDEFGEIAHFVLTDSRSGLLD